MATYDYGDMKRLEDLPTYDANGNMGNFVTLIKGKSLIYIPKRVMKQVITHHLDTCDVLYEDEGPNKGLVILDLNADGPYRLRAHDNSAYDTTDIKPRTLSATQLLRHFKVDDDVKHLVPCRVEGNLIVINLSERKKDIEIPK
jgi:hypothetical protein